MEQFRTSASVWLQSLRDSDTPTPTTCHPERRDFCAGGTCSAADGREPADLSPRGNKDAGCNLETAAGLRRQHGSSVSRCCLKTVRRGSRDATAEQIPPPQPRGVRDDTSWREAFSFYESAPLLSPKDVQIPRAKTAFRNDTGPCVRLLDYCFFFCGVVRAGGSGSCTIPAKRSSSLGLDLSLS